jgi:hypothetical protein
LVVWGVVAFVVFLGRWTAEERDVVVELVWIEQAKE